MFPAMMSAHGPLTWSLGPTYMRFASLEDDHWELESGEEQHALFPDTFWIPPASKRCALRRGDGAKLLFKLELEDEDGSTTHIVERMWVIVTRVDDGFYLGMLANQPASFDPKESEFYLGFGAEIPFRAEHVIAIGGAWPEEKLAGVLAKLPSSCTWAGGA